MRKVLFLAAFGSLLFSAAIVFFTAGNKNKKTGTDYSLPVDTIFLEYRFGMSEKEFESHTKKLCSEGRLTKKGIYNYRLKGFPSASIIEPEFHNGRLARLFIFPDNPNDASVNAIEQYNLLVGFYALHYPLEPDAHGVNHTYRKSNMVFRIAQRPLGPMVMYSDRRVMDKLEQEHDSIVKAKEIETKLANKPKLPLQNT